MLENCVKFNQICDFYKVEGQSLALLVKDYKKFDAIQIFLPAKNINLCHIEIIRN